jgi:hypothetical protein
MDPGAGRRYGNQGTGAHYSHIAGEDDGTGCWFLNDRGILAAGLLAGDGRHDGRKVEVGGAA